MLNISRTAMRMCRETVRQMPVPADSRLLRIDKDGDRVSIAFDHPHNDDEIVHHEGRPVLAVPHGLASTLSGLTLHVTDDGRFVLS